MHCAAILTLQRAMRCGDDTALQGGVRQGHADVKRPRFPDSESIQPAGPPSVFPPAGTACMPDEAFNLTARNSFVPGRLRQAPDRTLVCSRRQTFERHV